eukprot:TRINITY_DN11678_c0_g1_i7.p1 TRINITY_DN11678_c0_g1~~TRINITY_DN11678_c0_g1_i7.p1  ORF type:complete len:109 (+),score=16.78 TRINITY_DN11678_c0_g1_i7:500-826(+)
MGMVAKIGILDSKTFRTAGKKDALYNSILPTSSMIKSSVSSLTCSSGIAKDSNDAVSTLYFPTLGHLRDSALEYVVDARGPLLPSNVTTSNPTLSVPCLTSPWLRKGS